MNYEKIYNALVEKAKVRGLDKKQQEGYFEIHHILPRCLGGGDDKSNLVMFTAREHYVAHLLLWKMNPGHVGLFTAAFFMSKKRLFKFSSKLYEVLKIEQAKQLAEFNSKNSGFNSPVFKDLTGEVRGRLTVVSFDDWVVQSNGQRTSTWTCLCTCGNYSTVRAGNLTKNSGTRSCGCDRTEKMKEFVGEGNHFFGKTHSDETKAIMREKKLGKVTWNTGLVRSEETKRKVSEGLKARNRPAWEAGTVLTKDEQLTKWLMADYYYELYLTNTTLTSAKFTTLYNRLHNDNLPARAFTAMHREFVKGWIPLEDERWIKFSKEYQ